jgi:ABC-type branched-subunit amino acid transport system ATPase component
LTIDEILRILIERPRPQILQQVYQLFPRRCERKQNPGRQPSGDEQKVLAIGRAMLLNL